MNLDSKSLKSLEEFTPQLESISLRGKITLAILGLVILVGLYALYKQLSEGHIVTGMRDNVVWGLYIANFIFFIGISYAGALISGILHLLRVPWRTPIIRIAEIITVISTIIGPTYILLCMGRIDRVQNLLLFGRIQSPITWDVIAITTYLTGSIIFLYLASIRDFALLRDNPLKVAKWRNPLYKLLAVGFRNTKKQNELLGRTTDLLSIIIIPLAIIVHSVLAWIFGMTLRPGWHSTIFAPYFVIAAVYSGTGVLIIAMWFFRRIYHLESYLTKIHFRYLGLILLILGALYGYFTFSEYLTSWYGSEKWEMDVLHKLFNPSGYWWWFFFAAFIGVLLPIAIIAIPKFRTINAITFASVIAVVALWVKRYLIIIPTLEATLMPIHDLRPEYVHYSPTWVEWAITFAGVAMFILLFFLISKFIPIIPTMTVEEGKDYSRLRKLVKEKNLKEKLIEFKRKGKSTIVGLILLAIPLPFLHASETQQNNQLNSRLNIEYFNKTGEKSLVATLTSREGRTTTNLSNLNVSFFSVADTSKILLDIKQTDEKGQAVIQLPENLIQNNGFFNFEVLFEGTENYSESTNELEIKEVKMDISFSQESGEKIIIAKVTEISDTGELVPISDEFVNFYVPRTFTLLPIGEGTLEEGNTSIDFPVTLPGDTLGYLIIVAKIEENDIYGNVEIRGEINWGKPLPRMVVEKRGLGDTNAPLWMVYTLIVLLSTVWFHYLYSIYSIYLIKKEGNNPDISTDELS